MKEFLARLKGSIDKKGESDPEAARKQRQILVVAGIITVGMGIYYMSGESEKREADPVPEATELPLGRGVMEDSLGDELAEAQRQQQVRDAETSERIKGLEDSLALALRKMEEEQLNEIAPAAGPVERKYPPAPGEQGGNYDPFANAAASTAAPVIAPQPVVKGGIASFGSDSPIGVDAPKKSEGKSVYLPVSYMEATLLTGLDALASKDGTDNPEPVLIRVKAPAQLPNQVRANLKGCFMIGAATGSLAKERVEIRLNRISCLDLSEQAVVDQPIKGYVVDIDGKKGISGRVVTRAGASVARSFIAGVFQGVGETAQLSSQTRSVSPLGVTQTIDPGQAAAAGFGRGISQASEDLSKFYLDLARQAGPVIEVGAAKSVFVVVQEGVELAIKETERTTDEHR